MNTHDHTTYIVILINLLEIQLLLLLTTTTIILLVGG